jgi:L-iditol 2-dehydrogenase
MSDYLEPLVVGEYPLPAVEPGAILVRIERATVCGSDVHGWEGAYEGVLPVEKPLILGHEAVGVVAELGSGVAADSLGIPLAVGDRVVWASETCGQCWECTVLHTPTLCRDRRLGMLEPASKSPHFTGTFAEYCYVRPRAGRLRVPDGLPSTWASVATCAVRTVVNAWDLAGPVDADSIVVVQGSGPVGLFATAMARAAGAHRIIVIGGPRARLDIATAWGADDVIGVEDTSADERVETVLNLTDGAGATVVLEASGAPGAIEEGLSMARRAGRYVLIGSTGKGIQTISPYKIVNKGLQVRGSFSGDIDSMHRAMQFMLVHRARFDWDAVIGSEYSLDSVTEALEAMRSQRDIKPVIVPAAST